MKNFILILILCLTLTSCLATGVPYTSNPHTLLEYSYEMMNQGRGLMARNFIDTALEKYSKINDTSGMADAYYTYGNYYKVTMYVGDAKFTRHQDYNKSEESFRKAIELYASINQYEGLTRSYLGLGDALTLQGKNDKAMEAYDTSLIYYRKMKEENPKAELNILTGGYKDCLELINASKLYLKDREEWNKKYGEGSNFFTRNDIPTEPISFAKINCSYPVKLEKGCSGAWGAVQGIKINNHKAKVAATGDGKIVLVMWGNALIMTDEIKKIADDNQIKILRANTFVGFGGEEGGYILYTDGDLYSALRKYFY